MDAITDPQNQSTFGSVSVPHVEPDAVGGQEDNQRILARQTPSGVSRGVQQLGGPSLQADSGNKQITVTETVPQVLMGSQLAFGEGFYVTKPNINVLTSTSSDDFIFNSNQNVFKIVDSGLINNVVVPALSQTGVGSNSDGNDYDVLFDDDLGYVPQFIAYMNIFGGNYTPINYSQILTGGNALFTYQIIGQSASSGLSFSTITNILSAGAGTTNVSGFSGSIKWYILQETAN